PVHLDPSPHAFDFQNRRAGSAFDVTWSREGAASSAIPGSLLFERKPRPVTLTLLSAVQLCRAASQWLWGITPLVAAAPLARGGWTIVRASIADDVDWPHLRWILAGSIALNMVPIWWGLPAIWPPDELMPTTWLRGLEAHFANGWFDRWPPFHYYVLTAANAPVLLLNALGRVNFSGPPVARGLTRTGACGTLA